MAEPQTSPKPKPGDREDRWQAFFRSLEPAQPSEPKQPPGRASEDRWRVFFDSLDEPTPKPTQKRETQTPFHPQPDWRDTRPSGLGSAVRSFGRSYLHGVGSVPKYVGIAAKALGEERPLEELATHRLGSAIQQFGEEYFPRDRRVEESFWKHTLPGAFGSAAAFLTGGVAGKVLKLGTLGATAISGITGVAMESSNQYEEAKSAGASDDDAMNAWLWGHPIGAIEAVPIARAFRRFDRVTGGGLRAVLASGFKGTAEEAVQEAVQQVGSNIVAQQIYDPDRPLMGGIGESAAAGGIVGAATNMALTAAGLTTRRGRALGLRQKVAQLEKQLAKFDRMEATSQRPATPANQVEWTPREEIEVRLDDMQPRYGSGKYRTVPSHVETIQRSMEKSGYKTEFPLRVWEDPTTGRMVLLEGHHRLEAAEGAGLDQVPVRRVTGGYEEAAAAARRSNSQNAQLTPIEEARAFALEIKEGKSASQIGEDYGGLKVSHVNNRLKLNSLSPHLQDLVQQGVLDVPLAEVLGQKSNQHGLPPATQEEIFAKVISEQDLTKMELGILIDTIAPEATKQLTMGLGFEIDQGTVDPLKEIVAKFRKRTRERNNLNRIRRYIRQKEKAGEKISQGKREVLEEATAEIARLDKEIGDLQRSIGRGPKPTTGGVVAQIESDRAKLRMSESEDVTEREQPVDPVASTQSTATVKKALEPPETVRRSEIVSRLSESLQVPIRVGRFRQRALGIYKIQPRQGTGTVRVVRSAAAFDMGTISHEVGHHLNLLWWPKYTKQGKALLDTKQFLELKDEFPFLLQGLNLDAYPPSALPQEAWAEFIRHYLEDPALIQERAPRFYAMMESKLDENPDIRDVLYQFRTDLQRYNDQPATRKILSRVSQQGPPKPTNRWESLKTGLLDNLNPLKKAVESMGDVPTEQNSYELARLLAGWSGKADHFLEYGTFNFRGQQIAGEALTQILDPVRDNLDNFTAYLLARRAIEKSSQGIDTGIPVKMARESLNETDSPEFEQTAQRLYRYQSALLQYLEQAGVLSAEVRERVEELNEDYVPFYRVMQDDPGSLGQRGKTMANLWSPIKRMKGSHRDIVNPLESIVKNTYAFIHLAERNAVSQALVRQARNTEGAGWIVEEVPPEIRPTRFKLLEIQKQLKNLGVELTDEQLSAAAVVFSPSAFASPRDNIIRVLEGGEARFYQVHPDVYRTLMALDEEQANFVLRVLAAPARLLRLGATALGPEFAIRNPIRDTLQAALQSDVGVVPFLDTARGLFHVLKRDGLYQEWMRSGGPMAALVSLDRANLQSNLKDLTSSKVSWVMRHPIDAMRLFSEATEAATRVGVFAKAKAAGMTPAAAALESREATIDFAKKGQYGKNINMVVAFWNAGIQGTNKFIQVHKENPRRAATLGAAITAISLMNYALNRDDPDWQEVPNWQKDFFWLFPVKYTPLAAVMDQLPEWLQTKWIRIPKPFLWGMLYGSTMERAAGWLDQRDSSAFDDLAANLLQASTPGILPTAFIPPLEHWANRSFFTGRVLVPEYMAGISAKYQERPYTSEWAKTTSQALDRMGIPISPIHLDNYLYGYTAGAGRALSDISNMALRRGDAARTMADVPFLRAFAVRFPSSANKSVQDFYDEMGRLEQKKRTINSLRKRREPIPPADRMTSKESGRLARLRRFNKRLRQFNRQIRTTYRSSGLSPEEKRKRIDKLYLRITKLSQKALRR